mgnify:FL=1
MAVNGKKARRKGRGVRYFAAALLFVLLMGGVIALSVRADLASGEANLASLTGYVSKRCDAYRMTSMALETRGLIRLIEEAKQAARDIQYLEGPADESMLRELTLDHYLNGILLLDRAGEVVVSYAKEPALETMLAAELEKSVLLDTADHPQKTYAVRVYTADGSYIDMAACGQLDGDGVVVAYYKTPPEYVSSYGLDFSTLLDGYRSERNGTIVVTDGTTVLISNDESLVGLEADDIPMLRSINEQGKNGEMLMVRSGDNSPHRSFGMIQRGRTYHVYALLPERAIFDTTVPNAMVALGFYVGALLLVLLFQWKTAQGYHEQQLARDREYQARLKEEARRAESANVAKTEFLQRMSHDIRTPINGILGLVEIGEYYREDPEKQSECRRKIRDTSHLLLELVNEVLDMGKLESGEMVLEEIPFDLIPLLDAVGVPLEQTAKSRGIRIEWQPREVQHTALVGSPIHLKRLLMNLVSNAVRYNKDNGSVTLSCRELEDKGNTAWFEFICADTGIGMSEAYQQHLFEPFTQERSTARSTYGGTGLGMPIAKSLVDKMGGTITFTSRLGEGTTFRVILPFRICQPGELPPQAAKAPAPDELQGMRLLLVEDNTLNMEIAAFMLESAGAELTKAQNGQEALDIFRESPVSFFDAILMDVMMPVMDGYQANRAIRALERPDAAAVPIVAMTAHAFADDRQRAYEAGMTAHLAKPLESAVLIRTLQRWKKN